MIILDILCYPADVTSTVNDLESTWDKIQETDLHKHDKQLPSPHVEDSSGQLKNRSAIYPSSTSRSEVQRKTAKVSRSGNGYSKRPRLAQSEDNMSLGGIDEIKDISDNAGPHPSTKCNPLGIIFLLYELIKLFDPNYLIIWFNREKLFNFFSRDHRHDLVLPSSPYLQNFLQFCVHMFRILIYI